MKKSYQPSRLSAMLSLVAPATVLSLAPVTSDAAIYIKFDGIDGESTDKDHKGWIDVQHFSWGVSRSTDEGTSNKVIPKEMVVTKELDKSSPKLFLATVTGETISKVTIRVTRPGFDGAEEVYYEMLLEDVQIVRHTTDSKQVRTERPEEVVSLMFPKVEISYTPLNRSDPKVFVKWEFAK